MNKYKEIGVIIGLILLVILLVGVGPLITIWTLNTLFMQGAIVYSVKTWFASALLHMTIASLFRAGSK